MPQCWEMSHVIGQRRQLVYGSITSPGAVQELGFWRSKAIPCAAFDLKISTVLAKRVAVKLLLWRCIFKGLSRFSRSGSGIMEGARFVLHNMEVESDARISSSRFPSGPLFLSTLGPEKKMKKDSSAAHSARASQPPKTPQCHRWLPSQI